MRTFLALILMLSLACAGRAQTNAADMGGDVIQSIDDWMHQNLSDDALAVLEQIDRDRVREIFNAVQARFADTNVLELGSLKEAADRALPALKQFDETRPYAIWLEAHYDYLDAADRLLREMERTAPPTVTNRWAVPPVPPVALEREVWVQELKQRPWPPLAKEYVPRLKEIFTEERVPPELVWVAEVESSFDSRARSPAGAAGMFQLMPDTARDAKLSLWPGDDRLSPEKSARVAARRLRLLHAHYSDWRLAFAAYNAGEARVEKLLKQHQAKNYDAIARGLPAETQMYVPKLEATIEKREGRALAGLKMPGV